MFIELTHINGKKETINTDHIIRFRGTHDETRIWLNEVDTDDHGSNNNWMTVKESYEDIRDILATVGTLKVIGGKA